MTLTQSAVISRAMELGFADIGFTDASPLTDHRNVLESRGESYDWAYR